MQKKKSGVKKCMEICAIKGGGRRLMANAILNFHFDYFARLPNVKCLKMKMLPVNRAWRPDGMAVQRTTRVGQLDAFPQVVSGIGDRFYYRLKNKVMMVNFILMVKNTYLPSRARLF